MKLRKGFVSNSSSSSFLIDYMDCCSWTGKIKTVLTPEQVTKIQEYGFFKTYASYPDQVSNDSSDINKNIQELSKDEVYYNYGYDVICNEDEVLLWLVKNDISFSADCHYGQYTVVYKSGTNEVVTLVNAGHIYLMDSFNQREYKECIKRIPKEEFLKDCRYMI